MNKKIEDYLPYYIGQDIQTSDGSILKIASVHYGGWVNASGFLADGKQRVLKGYLSDEKLRLRPLSSMTKEEAKEVVNRQFKSWNAPIYERHSTLCIDVKFPAHEPNKFTYTQIDFDRLSPSAMHYLRKQGFDLFGLIPEGLAVDKTKEVPHG